MVPPPAGGPGGQAGDEPVLRVRRAMGPVTVLVTDLVRLGRFTYQEKVSGATVTP